MRLDSEDRQTLAGITIILGTCIIALFVTAASAGLAWRLFTFLGGV